MTDAPFTGLTRDSWGAVADRLLLSLRAWASPDHARIELPGPRSAYGRDSDSLEAFARSFLLVAIRLKGEDGNDPHNLAEWYADGLRAGTDPASPHAWPRPDQLGQAKVEACSIALGLHLSRPWLWDRLSDLDRERIIAWLATVVGEQYPPINWVWFQIVVETFLKSVGGPWALDDIESGLAVHESLYRGHGWYADGQERAYDHYNGWALHVYPLLWAMMDRELCDPALETAWRERLVSVPVDRGPPRRRQRLAAGPGAEPDLSLRRRRAVLDGRDHRRHRSRPRPAAPHHLGNARPLPRPRRPRPQRPAQPRLVRRMAGDRAVVLRVRIAVLGGEGHARIDAPGRPPGLDGTGGAVAGRALRLPLALPEPGWLVSGTRADGIVRISQPRHGSRGRRRRARRLAALCPAGVLDPHDAAAGHGVLGPAAREQHQHRASRTRPVASQRLQHREYDDARSPTLHWVRTSDDEGPEHGSGRGGAVVAGPAVAMASVLRGSHEVRAALIHPEAEVGPGRLLEISGWPLSAEQPPLGWRRSVRVPR